MMFHRPARFLFSLLLLASWIPNAGAQTMPSSRTPSPATQAPDKTLPSMTFHVSSRLVLLDIMVTNAKTGMAVGPLRADDFQLEENGVPQKIQSLTQDQQPLSIVFMLDLTLSVRPVLHILGEAAENVLSTLPSGDEVSVMVFSSTAKEIQGFTTDRKLAANALLRASRMRSGDATFLNESVYQAASVEQASHNPENRRVIVCLTDGTVNMPSSMNRKLFGSGVGNSALHTQQEAMRELSQTGTSFNAIIERSPLSYLYFASKYAGPAWELESKKNPPGDDHQYAEESGGLVLSTSKKEIVERLKTMLNDLRSRYTLAYQPSQPAAVGSFRTIQVRLTPEARERLGNVKLEARHGYIR